MLCRKSLFKTENPAFVAALGLYPDHVEEICYYSEKELAVADLDVIEKVQIKNKHQARQDFIQMAIRYGIRDFCSLNYFPYTHEEKISIVREFVGKLEKPKYIISGYLIGSVAQNKDHAFSDIDILIVRSRCLGDRCKIRDLEFFYPIDLWCHNNKEFESLKKRKPEIVTTAVQII